MLQKTLGDYKRILSTFRRIKSMSNNSRLTEHKKTITLPFNEVKCIRKACDEKKKHSKISQHKKAKPQTFFFYY